MKVKTPKESSQRSQAILGYYVYRIYGRMIAKLLYSTPITPNQVTFFSLILAMSASAIFLGGTHRYLVYGAVIYYLSKLFDYADGELARMRGTASRFGAWFDTYTDFYKIIVPMVAIGIGGYLNTSNIKFLILGFTSALLFSSFIITRLIQMATIGKTSMADFQITTKTHLGWTTPSSIIIVLFTLFNQAYYLLWLFSTIGALPLLIKIYTSYKSIKKFDMETKSKGK